MNLKQLVGFVVGVVALESVFILLGVLPPLSQSSFASLLFLLVRAIILVYSGWIATGFKNAAKNGATIAGSGLLTFFFATLIGSFIKVPVLGVSLPSGPEFLLVLVISLIINMLIGTILACFGYLIGPWLANFLLKPKNSEKSARK